MGKTVAFRRLWPALLLAGCVTPQAATDSRDLATTPPPPDAAVAPEDLAVPVGGSDAAAPPDQAQLQPADLAQPDLAQPPDLAIPIQTGMTWPDTQIFPSFAPLGPLDVIDASGFAADKKALTVTLEGLVNRTRPRIYVQDNDGEGKSFWLSRLGAATTAVTDPFALVTKYKSEVKGVVIYDDALVDTVNLATVIAGQRDAVVASPAVAATLTAAPYSLPVVADLRANHFAGKLDVYQYELDHWAGDANHRMIIGLNPTISGNLRDYALATKSMMVWLDPRVPAEKSMLASYLALLPPNSPYLGWWADEPTGVQAASTGGVPTYAADWSCNLTVLGGTPRGSVTPAPAVPAPPPLENKVYVAIFMSDGDNLQEDQHLVPLKWADAHRGGVPIGWTLDPALVDVAPVILRYFQQSATVNDVLVSGPSGLGYTYPAAWPASKFESYAQVTGRYMSAAGLRVVTLWNNGVDLSTANAHAYAANVPGLVGMTIQDESRAVQLVDNWLPVVRLAISYGDTEQILENGIDAQLAGWSHAGPLFVAVQGNMNMGTIHPTAFWNVQQHYAGNANVTFVRADHFFQLLRTARQPPQHQMLGGDFTGDGKTDSLFYYGGDGNWWMGVSDGAKLDWHLAANVASLGNLIDGQHVFYTGDFTGDGKTDVLVYGANDNTWRLGTSDGNKLTFSVAGTTGGFGSLLDGKHQTFIGDFTGDGKDDVLFYYNGDGHIFIGASNGSTLTWKLANTADNFGNLLDGAHTLYSGDYNGDGKRDLAFYYNGDGHWFVGLSDGANITWHLAAETAGFGNLLDPSRRLLAGDFDGDGKRDLLFHYNGDGNWWMGLSDGTSFKWHLAGTFDGGGNLLDWSHRLFVGDYDGNGKSDVASYDSGDGSWWVGLSDGDALTWHQAGSAGGTGNLVDPSRLLFAGDYDGGGKSDFLGYDSADGNWRMGVSDGTSFTWHLAGNTSGFGDLTH